MLRGRGSREVTGLRSEAKVGGFTLLLSQLQEIQGAGEKCRAPLKAGMSQETPSKLGARGYVPSVGRNEKDISPCRRGQKANLPVLTLTLG